MDSIPLILLVFKTNWNLFKNFAKWYNFWKKQFQRGIDDENPLANRQVGGRDRVIQVFNPYKNIKIKLLGVLQSATIDILISKLKNSKL